MLKMKHLSKDDITLTAHIVIIHRTMESQVIYNSMVGVYPVGNTHIDFHCYSFFYRVLQIMTMLSH